MKKFVQAKLHGMRVTQAALHYHGSITLDPDICSMAGIMPLEFVEIFNKNSGSRISTYVIFGEAGSGCCVLNGAAARTCQVGDEVIICSSIYADAATATKINPRILTFDDRNAVQEILEYRLTKDRSGRFNFEIADVSSELESSAEVLDAVG